MTSTPDCSEQIYKLKSAIKSADAILIGAGAGLSTSAGFTYSGERFLEHFADFHAKYGISDMYSGGFYPYKTLEEYWAWWSRHVLINRYADAPKPVYNELFELVRDKDYFVITTNVDHCFQRRALTNHAYSTRRAITACFNAQSPATTRRTTTKRLFAAWWTSKRI